MNKTTDNLNDYNEIKEVPLSKSKYDVGNGSKLNFANKNSYEPSDTLHDGVDEASKKQPGKNFLKSIVLPKLKPSLDKLIESELKKSMPLQGLDNSNKTAPNRVDEQENKNENAFDKNTEKNDAYDKPDNSSMLVANTTNTDQLLELLIEERENNKRICEAYEERLEKARNDVVQENLVYREKLVHNFEEILNKYKSVSQEAMNIAKKARAYANQLEKQIYDNSQKACKAFEKDCKDKIKDIIVGYRYLANKAQEDSNQKIKELSDRYVKLEVELKKLKDERDTQVSEMVEEKLYDYANEFASLKQENKMLKFEYENSVSSIRVEFLSEMRRFEAQLIAVTLKLLWDYNILISEAELRTSLFNELEEEEQQQATLTD